MNIILDTWRILTKNTPLDLMHKKLKRLLTGAFGNSACAAAYDILEKLSSSGPLNNSLIRSLSRELEKKLGAEVLKAVSEEIAEQTEEAYRYAKKRSIIDHKLHIESNLSIADVKAIEHLTKANHAWIRGHSLKSEIAKEITESLAFCHRSGLTRKQTATIMARKYGSLVPENIAARYGEARYWDGFVRGHATRTRTFADIETFSAAGMSHYVIFSRLTERTCPICRRMHGQVYSVQSCQVRMQQYYAASQTGNMNGMKKAFPWLSAPPEQKKLAQGLLPPFHYLCECRIRVYREKMSPTKYSGKTMVNVARQGQTYYYMSAEQKLKDKILYTCTDSRNKEWVFTDRTQRHCQHGLDIGSHTKYGKVDPSGVQKCAAAIKSTAWMGEDKHGDVVLCGNNGYIVVMRDNVVWTTYFADYGHPAKLTTAIRNGKKRLLKKGGKIYD